jgi:hypothetical protein
MNKNLKNGLMVGGGVLVAYLIWKSMQPKSDLRKMAEVPKGQELDKYMTVMPDVQTGQVSGAAFSGLINTDPIVGKRVW